MCFVKDLTKRLGAQIWQRQQQHRSKERNAIWNLFTGCLFTNRGYQMLRWWYRLLVGSPIPNWLSECVCVCETVDCHSVRERKFGDKHSVLFTYVWRLANIMIRHCFYWVLLLSFRSFRSAHYFFHGSTAKSATFGQIATDQMRKIQISAVRHSFASSDLQLLAL